MVCVSLELIAHVLQRLFTRGISVADVEETIHQGSIIKRYDDDKPFPSVLLLHFVLERPLHPVVAQDPATGICVAVTVYEPDPLLWNADFTEKIRT
ncbi:MAG: DUF4258 domain-containing protein [Hymenobacter sp.]|nr:DUF4258 domain-containing protein [Hymenobacter sp.]